MPKKTKDSVPVSMRLDRNVYERLRAYADEKGQNYTVAVERIITAYLDEQAAREKKGGK
jgi:predicted DNA-binding protein